MDELSASETRLIDVTQPEFLEGGKVLHESLCSEFGRLILDLETVPVQREFQITRRLGRGRQGVVFEGYNNGFLGSSTKHALKLFDPSLFAANRSYDIDMLRIAKQVSVLQQLYHPNLVQCEAFYEINGIGMLLMELINGLDLKQMLDPEAHNKIQAQVSHKEWDYLHEVIFQEDGKGLQPTIALYIFRKMLRGLEILHRTGYVHCDIKPSNVMSDRFGTVKLVDFGRATLIKDPGEQFLASPMYMAPEMHERGDFDQRVDLYSSALVLLELLWGESLIDDYSTEEVIRDFKIQLYDDFGDFLPKKMRKNKDFMKFMKKMLAWNKNDRFPTSEDMDEVAQSVVANLMAKERFYDAGVELEKYLVYRLPQAEGLKKRKKTK
ncbi:MAG: serine/threonine protein kinase [Lentisphaeria bacterium]|nr:serine/threonine protein kinase [Lentisphaeria bacterium]